MLARVTLGARHLVSGSRLLASAPKGRKRVLGYQAGTTGSASARTGNHLGLLALFLALVMRLLVPTGFMWDTASNGGAQLVPCSGMAPARAGGGANAMHHMAMSADGRHERHDKGGDTSSRECAFAALSGALDLAEPYEAPAALLLVASALPILAVQTAVPGQGLAAPPPPSRGPPATS